MSLWSVDESGALQPVDDVPAPPCAELRDLYVGGLRAAGEDMAAGMDANDEKHPAAEGTFITVLGADAADGPSALFTYTVCKDRRACACTRPLADPSACCGSGGRARGRAVDGSGWRLAAQLGS